MQEYNKLECRALYMIPERIAGGLPEEDKTLWELFDGKRSLYECIRLRDRQTDRQTENKEFQPLLEKIHAWEKAGALRLHYTGVTAEQFRQALEKLGVRKGMNLVVHSTFSSLGKTADTPADFCRVLQDAVGPEGTLLLPTFTFSLYHPGDPAGTFDIRKTPSAVGVLTETFRHLPGVYRSGDPCHAYAAWGKNALALVRDHHKVPTVSERSPLGLLENMEGYCMTIAARGSVTFMHVVEYSRQAPCLSPRSEEYQGVLADGRKVKLRTWSWRGTTCPDCPSLHPQEIFDAMRKNGTLREVMAGHALICLFRLADYRKVYEEMLEHCGCLAKEARPRVVAATVESDWDSAKNQLKDTDAFVGELYP